MDVFLNFKRRDLQQKYYEDCEPHLAYSRKTLLASIILNIILSGVVQIACDYKLYFSRWEYNLIGSCGIIVVALLYVASYCYLKKLKDHKKRRHAKTVVIAVDICQAVVFAVFWSSTVMITPLHSVSPKATGAAVLFGISSLSGLYISVQLLHHWYTKSGLLISGVLVITIRSFLIYQNDKSVVANIILKCVAILYAFYLQERSRKCLFIKKENEYEKSKIWKNILSNLSEGVLIIGKNSKLLYINASLSDLLELPSEELAKDSTLGIFSKFRRVIATSVKRGVNRVFGEQYHQNEELTSWQEEEEECRELNLEKVLHTILQQWNKHEPSTTFNRCTDAAFNSIISLEGCIEAAEPNAEDQYYQISISLTLFDGQPALVMLFTNITQLKDVVRLRSQDEYKSRMLASVSHELRTPLNGSLNFLQLALEDEHVPKRIKQNALIPTQRSNLLLLNLINDILDFSRMQAKTLSLIIENKDILDTIKEGIELIELQARKKGIQVVLAYEHLTHSKFATDHTRAKQILLNLLSNAVKFTQRGSITIAVTELSLDGGDQGGDLEKKSNMLKISVKDTGIGITEDQQTLLFREYSQVGSDDNKKKLNPHGVGLGLVISNLLASLLGPDALAEHAQAIYVNSLIDVGTEFAFVLEEKPLGVNYTRKKSRKMTYNPQNRSSYNSKIDTSNQVLEGTNTHRFNSKENSLLQLLSSPNHKTPSRETRDRFEVYEIKSLESARLSRVSSSATVEEPYSSIAQLNSSPKLSASREAFLVRTRSNVAPPNHQKEVIRLTTAEDSAPKSVRRGCKCSRILVVDDDSFNIMAYELILSSLNLTADCAYNGREAIDKILQKNLRRGRSCRICSNLYDMVFMDLTMPIMDGFEAATKLKELMSASRIRPFPLVCCTAMTQDKDSVVGIIFDDVCMKPLTKTIISDILKKFNVVP